MKIRVNGFFVSRAAMVTPGVPMPLKSPKTWQFQESSELRSFIIATADEVLIQCFRKIRWVKSNYFHDIAPEAILDIDDIAAYNKKEGLSLSPEEVEYLDNPLK
jgi:phosphoribosylformylglycinamidine synthase